MRILILLKVTKKPLFKGVLKDKMIVSETLRYGMRGSKISLSLRKEQSKRVALFFAAFFMSFRHFFSQNLWHFKETHYLCRHKILKR